MYSIGDKVVYPLHGAGVIKSIENKKFSNIEKQYYTLAVPCSGLDIMIPVEKCHKVGIRPVITKEEVDGVNAVLTMESEPIEANWSRRYRENLEILKTGDIHNVAKVVRDLSRLEQKKPLSTGEKKMLTNANSILASEISLAEDKSVDEIVLWIKEKVKIDIT